MKKIVLADARHGQIVRHRGRWGVVCSGGRGYYKRNHRMVDFWGGGREWVRNHVSVEVQAT